MNQAKERASRVKRRAKEIFRLRESHQKTPYDLSGSVEPESASTALNPQPHSGTDSLKPCPKDSPPIPILSNQNSSSTDNPQLESILQQSCQGTADLTSNGSSQIVLEQPPRRLQEHDNQGLSLLVIGTLWEQAAQSLDEVDREELNRLLKSKREGEAADARKEHGTRSPPDGHGKDLPTTVSSVLSEAKKCKEKSEKATWKSVRLAELQIC
jgi:hypothetical protein